MPPQNMVPKVTKKVSIDSVIEAAQKPTATGQQDPGG